MRRHEAGRVEHGPPDGAAQVLASLDAPAVGPRARRLGVFDLRLDGHERLQHFVELQVDLVAREFPRSQVSVPERRGLAARVDVVARRGVEPASDNTVAAGHGPARRIENRPPDGPPQVIGPHRGPAVHLSFTALVRGLLVRYYELARRRETRRRHHLVPKGRGLARPRRLANFPWFIVDGDPFFRSRGFARARF